MSFFEDYVTAALWASTDDSDDSGGNPMDDNYGPEDIAPETLATMRTDCEDFEAANADDLAEYEERTGYTGGVDFWLTRNGHGAGFWDCDLGELSDRLSAAATVYSARDLYIGDDGLIYQA